MKLVEPITPTKETKRVFHTTYWVSYHIIVIHITEAVTNQEETLSNETRKLGFIKLGNVVMLVLIGSYAFFNQINTLSNMNP